MEGCRGRADQRVLYQVKDVPSRASSSTKTSSFLPSRQTRTQLLLFDGYQRRAISNKIEGIFKFERYNLVVFSKIMSEFVQSMMNHDLAECNLSANFVHTYLKSFKEIKTWENDLQ